MAINLNDNIFSASPKLLDAKWGPFPDTTAAYAAVGKSFRKIGMFAIIAPLNGTAQLWWYKNDTDNLVLFSGNSSVQVYDVKENPSVGETAFPTVGSVDVIYIDKSESKSYYWTTANGGEYVLTSGTSGVEVYSARNNFPLPGSEGIVYVAADTDYSYLWDPAANSGTGNYVQITNNQGKSAYDIWVEEGNTGTEQDFLDSLVGPQGPEGLQGLTGPQGETGPAGPTGPTGPSGTVTINGLNYVGVWSSLVPYTFDYGDVVSYNGASYVRVVATSLDNGSSTPDSNSDWVLLAAQGATGPTGSQGPVGDTGPQGPQGEGGPQGPQGIEGPQGIQGSQGEQGVQGADGPQGDQGPKGDQGDIGPAGPTGDTGPQGIQGDAGPVGPAGLTWKSAWVANTSYDKDDAVGYAGASWFCILTHSGISTPPNSDSTRWALLASQGAVGPQGPTGATGATGSQGPEGPQGIQGIQGPRGFQGNDGATGPQGPKGDQGIQGPQGLQGPIGLQGPPGDNGQDALWNFTQAYNPGASYAVGDIVTYDGETWYRLDANGGNVGNTPVEGTFWTKLAAKGADGDGGGVDYYVDTGTANNYAITTGKSLTVNAIGDTYLIKFTNANTGASNLSVDGITAASLVNSKTQGDLASGDIPDESVHLVVYTGTDFEIVTIGGGSTGGGIPKGTASGTDTYTVSITGVVAYNDGDAYLIRFTNGNTTGATLNINSLGAKTLYRNNDGPLIGGDIFNGGEMICIYNSTLNGFQCIGSSPNSLFAYVTNGEASTISKGQVVYASGGTGDRMVVMLASNSQDSTSAKTVGVVYSTSIGANQKGIILMQGLIDGLSILPTSTWADGDSVYLGATAGSITKTKPYAPNHLVYIATVTTASNGNAGRMYVKIQNGYELEELHDVDLITSAPAAGQFLRFDGSLWKNASLPIMVGATASVNGTAGLVPAPLIAERTLYLRGDGVWATNVATGSIASGEARRLALYPTTSTGLDDTLDSGNTRIVIAAHATGREYTIDNVGAAASFVMTQGTQTIAGAKTFTSTTTTQNSLGTSLNISSLYNNSVTRTYSSITSGADTTVTHTSAALLTTGTLVRLANVTGITNITANTDYYVYASTATTLKLATTYANALAGTPIATTGTYTGGSATLTVHTSVGSGTTFNFTSGYGSTPLSAVGSAIDSVLTAYGASTNNPTYDLVFRTMAAGLTATERFRATSTGLSVTGSITGSTGTLFVSGTGSSSLPQVTINGSNNYSWIRFANATSEEWPRLLTAANTGRFTGERINFRDSGTGPNGIGIGAGFSPTNGQTFWDTSFFPSMNFYTGGDTSGVGSNFSGGFNFFTTYDIGPTANIGWGTGVSSPTISISRGGFGSVTAFVLRSKRIFGNSKTISGINTNASTLLVSLNNVTNLSVNQVAGISGITTTGTAFNGIVGRMLNISGASTYNSITFQVGSVTAVNGTDVTLTGQAGNSIALPPFITGTAISLSNVGTISGLTANTTYYVYNYNPTGFSNWGSCKLALTYNDAINGIPITSASGSFTWNTVTSICTVAPIAANTTQGVIVYGTLGNLTTSTSFITAGTRVSLSNITGLSGITANTNYFLYGASSATYSYFRLASSFSNAIAGTAITGVSGETALNLTGTATSNSVTIFSTVTDSSPSNGSLTPVVASGAGGNTVGLYFDKDDDLTVVSNVGYPKSTLVLSFVRASVDVNSGTFGLFADSNITQKVTIATNSTNINIGENITSEDATFNLFGTGYTNNALSRNPVKTINIGTGAAIQTNFATFRSTTNITIGNYGSTNSSAAARSFINLRGKVSITPYSGNYAFFDSSSWTTAGAALEVANVAIVDTTSAASSTIAFRTSVSFAVPSFASTNAITVTDAANVYIAGNVAASTNTTITNSWALYVATGGNTRLSLLRVDGNVGFYGTTPVARASAYTQTYSAVSTPNTAKTHSVSTYVSPGTYAAGTNGYSTAAQAQAIITALGQLNSDVTVVKNLINSIIDDLQAYGLFQ